MENNQRLERGDSGATAQEVKRVGIRVGSKTNVTVILEQEGKRVDVIHSLLVDVSIDKIINVAENCWHLDDSLPLYYVVYNDDADEGIDQVLMNGVINPEMFTPS